MPKKKAQGISITVVVAAVIALIVLVVLIVIFTGRTTVLSKTTAACDQKGIGARCAVNCTSEELKYSYTDCDATKGGKYCCVPVG